MERNTVKKSTFFDFLNRYTDYDFKTFWASSKEDVHYIDWHGFCLTMSYGNAASEYNAVRNTCALFDASPIKKYKFTGADAGPFLDVIMTRQMSRQKPMHVIYATLCNENGMLLDDGLLYKYAEDDYLLMISEMDHDEHFAKASIEFNDLLIEEVTPSLSGLAVQGPKSCAVLASMGFSSIEKIQPFEIKFYNLYNSKVIVSRVGFTADLGYEVWFEPGLNKTIEQAIHDAETTLDFQIAGYGLKALNALRLEGGFIVPGWETAQTFENDEYERTPAELGIAWTVDLNRTDDFIGKAALLKEKENGQRYKTIGLTIGKRCEIEDGATLYSVIDGVPRQVGTLPSVAWSYELDCYVTLASIRFNLLQLDSQYYIEIDGQQIDCHEVKLPFVKFNRYRQTPAPG
jgi:aminomethyltransferase